MTQIPFIRFSNLTAVRPLVTAAVPLQRSLLPPLSHLSHFAERRASNLPHLLLACQPVQATGAAALERCLARASRAFALGVPALDLFADFI